MSRLIERCRAKNIILAQLLCRWISQAGHHAHLKQINCVFILHIANMGLIHLEVLGLSEVSILEEVGDGEKDEERSDVESPEEQPVDLVVEHLGPGWHKAL